MVRTLDVCTSAKLRRRPRLMRQIAHCHASVGKLATLEDGKIIRTLANEDTPGDKVTVQKRGSDKITLNGKVNVVKAGVESSNGVVHVIDGLLCTPGGERAELEATMEGWPATLCSSGFWAIQLLAGEKAQSPTRMISMTRASRLPTTVSTRPM